MWKVLQCRDLWYNFDLHFIHLDGMDFCLLPIMWLQYVINNLHLFLLLFMQVSKKYKVGILYCRAGQTTEEEMYNNGKASTANIRIPVF